VSVDPIRRRLDRLLDHALTRALVEAAAPRRIWIVGGALRDAALGVEVPTEIDALVERDATEVAERLANGLPARLVRLGGERFSALRLIADRGILDLWDLAGAPLAEDLARRDFTINAWALCADGEVVDPFGGLDDIGARRLRATRPSVFAEDPLRVLRLARFLVTLPDFREEPKTGRSAREAAAGLTGIAGERIRGELERIWSCPAYASAFGALERSAAWPLLWLPADQAQAAMESPVASAGVVDLELVTGPRVERHPPAARVAVGHVLAARAAGGTEARSSLEALARRAVLSNAELRTSLSLLALVAQPPGQGDGELAWWLHRAQGLGVHALALATAFDLGRRDADLPTALRRARGLLEQRGEEILSPRPLLSGDEIAMQTGLAPGPGLGRLVAALREAQVRGTVKTRPEALALLGELARNGRG